MHKHIPVIISLVIKNLLTVLIEGFAIITLLSLKLLAQCITIGNAGEEVGQTIPARLFIAQMSKSH